MVALLVYKMSTIPITLSERNTSAMTLNDGGQLRKERRLYTYVCSGHKEKHTSEKLTERRAKHQRSTNARANINVCDAQWKLRQRSSKKETVFLENWAGQIELRDICREIAECVFLYR